jgi:hypothetical protein
MATIIAFKTTIENIVNEVEKFDGIEQESILAYLRARRIRKKNGPKLASAVKPLSMTAINTIKHKSRQSAGK